MHKINKLIYAAFILFFLSNNSIFAEDIENKTKSNAKEQKVYVGLYLADVSGFDINQGRFSADLQVWCKWLGENKTPEITFANGEIEKKTLLSEESDGDWHSARWRVQGTFRGTFPLHKYPFDQQQLKIQVDLPKSEGALFADLAGSGMSSEFSITGWKYDPYFKAKSYSQNYYSDFGSIEREGDPLQVSSVDFILQLKRPSEAYLIKFALPLLIIILTSIIALLVPVSELEVRAGMIITSLLSAIALSFSQAESLPDVSYPVIADKLFIVSYLMILASLTTTVTVFHLSRKSDEWIKKGRIVDKSVVACLFSTIIIGSIIMFTVSSPEQEKAHFEDLKKPALHKSSGKELKTLYPSLNYLSGVHGLLHRSLCYYGKNGKKLPHLATEAPSMENDKVRFLPNGGMVVRWQLKPNLLWSNKKPITSEDLEFSINRSEDPFRTKVTIIDEYTVDVEYSKRFNEYLSCSLDVLPKYHFEEIFKKGGQEAVREELKMNPPPLTGPYYLEKLEIGKEVIFKRNPSFAGIQPSIETIKLVVTDKGKKEWFPENIANHVNNISQDSLELVLESTDTAKKRTDPSSSIVALFPDLDNPPLNNLKARQAVIHAIDRNHILQIYGKEGQVAHSYVPSHLDDYEPNVKKYEYNPQKAKQLLRSAGFSLPVPITLYTQDRSKAAASERLLLEETVKYLNNAGFKVSVEVVKSTATIKKQGDFKGLTLTASPSYPSIYWNVKYSPETGYLTEEPNRLFDAEAFNVYSHYRGTMFEERKKILSQKLQILWAEKLPAIPLVSKVSYSVFDKDLVGWNPSASGENGSEWWNVEHLHFKK